MQQNKSVRVIKRNQTPAPKIDYANEGVRKEVVAERKVRAVISGWVSESKRRSEQLWRDNAAILASLGYQRG
ncbi:MAG: hypothetical protein ACRD9R_08070 [Pyrinomonadaceae bacterium]